MHKKFKQKWSLDAMLNAPLQQMIFYHFQLNTDDTITPFQPLHKKGDFPFHILYKILVPKDISLQAVIAVISVMESLYPKHPYNWEVVQCETIKDNAITVCLVERLAG